MMKWIKLYKKLLSNGKFEAIDILNKSSMHQSFAILSMREQSMVHGYSLVRILYLFMDVHSK